MEEDQESSRAPVTAAGAQFRLSWHRLVGFLMMATAVAVALDPRFTYSRIPWENHIPAAAIDIPAPIPVRCPELPGRGVTGGAFAWDWHGEREVLHGFAVRLLTPSFGEIVTEAAGTSAGHNPSPALVEVWHARGAMWWQVVVITDRGQVASTPVALPDA